jgi:hypothetical protein
MRRKKMNLNRLVMTVLITLIIVLILEMKAINTRLADTHTRLMNMETGPCAIEIKNRLEGIDVMLKKINDRGYIGQEVK